MSRGLGTAQQKILLLLLGGLALGLSGSPKRYFRILKTIGKEWREIERHALRRAIQKLYESKLVEAKAHKDGSTTLILSEEGKKRALTFKIDEMQIRQPKMWDKKWRIVTFDIPEEQKRVRDALRGHLRRLGLSELQKSVFVYPYPCINEIDFIVEWFNIRPYVRQITADFIDNELHLKSRFKLL